MLNVGVNQELIKKGESKWKFADIGGRMFQTNGAELDKSVVAVAGIDMAVGTIASTMLRLVKLRR